MEAVPASCLGDVRPLALQACVIGIDEGQFVSLSIAHPTMLFLKSLEGQNFEVLCFSRFCFKRVSTQTIDCFLLFLVSSHSGVLRGNGQSGEDSHCSSPRRNLPEKGECIFPFCVGQRNLQN